MTKTYISGRITGINEDESRWLFELALEHSIASGERPVNPWNIGPLFGIKKYWCYVIADLIELLKCDKILLLPNWGDSRGAKIEFAVALFFNLKFEYL